MRHNQAQADFFTVKPEQRAKYTHIIDKILRKSDLNTISAKAIRKELAAELGYDVSEQKVISPTDCFNPVFIG